jgi:hypothetical protein
MSELINTHSDRKVFRETLLTTACGLALLTYVGVSSQAKAENAERPTVWIELGGQLERMGNSEEIFDPPFVSKFDHLNFQPVLSQLRPPRYSNGAEGKLSLMPRDLDWVLSAAVRYGRSNGKKELRQQLPKFEPFTIQGIGFGSVYTVEQRIPYHENSYTQHEERHLVLDFKAGKDVGLGLFGAHGTSVMSLGVRFAQFTAGRGATLNGQPTYTIRGDSKKYGFYRSRHHYTGSVTAENSFHGIGPSLSWDASAPLLNRGDDGQINVDWGLNAAILFGRQKTKGEDHATGTHYTNYTKFLPFPPLATHSFTIVYQHRASFSRSRRVTVPNVGGFAGVSFRYSDVKLSMGYRADVYFGAMDGGIETRRSENRSFYGPFASFSIGFP